MPREIRYAIRALLSRTTMTEIWLPTDLPRTNNWSQRIDVAVGRLKPGVTLDAAATLLLVCVAMAACLNPARRAMKLDPMTVLRHE